MRKLLLAAILSVLCACPAKADYMTGGGSGGGGGTATTLNSVGHNQIILGSDVVGLDIKEYSGQTGDIEEWHASDGTLLGYVQGNNGIAGLQFQYASLGQLDAGITVINDAANDATKLEIDGKAGGSVGTNILNILDQPGGYSIFRVAVGGVGISTAVNGFGDVALYKTLQVYGQTSSLVGFTVTALASPDANLVEVNSNAGSGGDLARIDYLGRLSTFGGILPGQRQIWYGPSAVGSPTLSTTGSATAALQTGAGNSYISDHQLVIPYTSAATTNQYGSAYLNGAALDVTAFDLNPSFSTTIVFNDITQVRFWSLLTSYVAPGYWLTDTPGATDGESGFGFRFSTSAGDTNIQCATFNAASDSFTDSTIPVVSGHTYRLSAWGISGTKCVFQVHDLTAGTFANKTITTTLPVASTKLQSVSILTTLANVAKTFAVGNTFIND